MAWLVVVLDPLAPSASLVRSWALHLASCGVGYWLLVAQGLVFTIVRKLSLLFTFVHVRSRSFTHFGPVNFLTVYYCSFTFVYVRVYWARRAGVTSE